MSLEVAVDVDLHRAVSDAYNDVVPVSLIPMAIGRECAPLALAAENLVLDAVGCHGQVELLGSSSASGEDRPMLSGAAHAIAGEDRAGGEFGQLGHVVVGETCGSELDEGGRSRREREDVCGG